MYITLKELACTYAVRNFYPFARVEADKARETLCRVFIGRSLCRQANYAESFQETRGLNVL